MSPAPPERLLRLLPSIYQQPVSVAKDEEEYATRAAVSCAAPLLLEYLRPYAAILFGGDDGVRGLEAEIAEDLVSVIDPQSTPDEFLDWLCGWVALELPVSVTPKRKRRILAAIVPLYAIRGTRRYLEELLDWVLDVPAEVRDRFPHFCIAEQSTLGVDTFVGGGPANFFRVTLRFQGKAGEDYEGQSLLAEEIINLAKPAHTAYELVVSAPRVQIQVRSTIGLDMVL